MTQAKGIPDGFHTLCPYMMIRNAGEAIEFYKRAFDATVHLCLTNPQGKVMHAEIQIGDSMVMLADDSSDTPSANSPISLFLYVPDVDTFAERALTAGATLIDPIEDKWEGDRRGGLQDPFGFTWWIATQTRVMSRADMQRQHDQETQKA
jgi:PhnB protein